LSFYCGFIKYKFKIIFAVGQGYKMLQIQIKAAIHAPSAYKATIGDNSYFPSSEGARKV
jgi:hypothetical protein